jgi:hypothetical protein
VSVAHVCLDVMVVQIFARLFVQLNHGLTVHGHHPGQDTDRVTPPTLPPPQQ